jgi:hypothetical protein
MPKSSKRRRSTRLRNPFPGENYRVDLMRPRFGPERCVVSGAIISPHGPRAVLWQYDDEEIPARWALVEHVQTAWNTGLFFK